MIGMQEARNHDISVATKPAPLTKLIPPRFRNKKLNPASLLDKDKGNLQKTTAQRTSAVCSAGGKKTEVATQRGRLASRKENIEIADVQRKSGAGGRRRKTKHL